MPWICEACGTEIDNDFNYCSGCEDIIEPIFVEDDEYYDEEEDTK